MSKQPEREIDDRLADWVDGRLSERERERFVAELRVNAQLRLDLAEYERTVAAVRAALRAPTQPSDLTARVMAAVAGQAIRGTSGGSASRRHPLYWSLAAAAALLVLAVAIDRWPTGASPADSGPVDRVASLDAAVAHDDDAAALRKAQEKPGEVFATEETERTEKKVPELGALAEAPAAPAPATIAPGAPDGGGRGGAEGPGAAATAAAKGPVPAQKPAPEGNPVNDPAKPAGDLSAIQSQLAPVPQETSRREDYREVGAAVGEKAKEDLGWAKAESSRGSPTGRESETKPGVPDTDSYTRGSTFDAWGALASPYATQPLPMVSLTRYRSALSPTTGGPAAAPNKSAPSSTDFYVGEARNPTVPSELMAFLASQVEQPSLYFKRAGEALQETAATADVVRYGNLRLVPLAAAPNEPVREQAKDAERRAARVGTEEKHGQQQEGAPASAADPRAPTESHWLVEGSKTEVAGLLRSLRDYAKRAGLELTNGELTADSPVLRGRRRAPGAEVAPAPAAPSPPTPREPARPAGPPTGAEAARTDQEQARIVLRFRVLPPK
jgi:hypothetical protein